MDKKLLTPNVAVEVSRTDNGKHNPRKQAKIMFRSPLFNNDTNKKIIS